jgi:hypothetical protein
MRRFLLPISRSTLGLALAFAVALTLGCSHDDCEISDPDVKASPVNPDGLAYPTDDIGGNARTDSKSGQRIPNFAFSGYLNGDQSKGLVTVSLADFYDPSSKRSKVLHLIAACVWCPVCQAETAQMSSSIDDLKKEGLVAVQVLIQGKSRGRGTSLCDIQDWTASRVNGFTVLMDVDAKRLGTVESIDGVPWNAIIDTRSMEILSIDVGRPDDYPSYVRGAISWVSSHPSK